MKVNIYVDPKNRRSNALCDAWDLGLRRHGIKPLMHDVEFYGGPTADVAVFYGLRGKLRDVQRDYSGNGRHAVFLDMGYWGRDMGGKLAGFHRVTVDGLHANAYFQSVKHGPDRVSQFGLNLKPWADNNGGYILLCGQSAKAAGVFGLRPEEWERKTVAALREHTNRVIMYRPKPSWKGYEAMEGTALDDISQPIQESLAKTWAVVTHHSNAAIDAMLEGVPAFTVEGLAKVLCTNDLSLIESPPIPNGAAVGQFLNNVAYVQWSVAEMASGKCLEHISTEVFKVLEKESHASDPVSVSR